jgi:hypothetical protein
VSGRDTEAVKRACSQTAAQVTDFQPSVQNPRAGDPGLRGSPDDDAEGACFHASVRLPQHATFRYPQRI